jgi:hypothetical protein
LAGASQYLANAKALASADFEICQFKYPRPMLNLIKAKSFWIKNVVI